MNKSFTRKKQQELILKKSILDSWLITEEIVNEAEKLYNNIAYHNFLHALRVTSYVLLLDKTKFSPLEIRSLLIVWLFHDAWHTWDVTKLDEFISLSYFREVMDKFPDFVIDDSICRSWIIWTVFSNRWKNLNKYAKIMADLDIWDIWMWIADFLYYSSLYSIEIWVSPEYFYTEEEKKYFKFIISIDKNILISEEAIDVLPNSFKTIREFYKIDLDAKIKIFNTLLNEDITLEEFKTKFFHNKKEV